MCASVSSYDQSMPTERLLSQVISDDGRSRKRPYDEGDEDGEAPAKRQARSPAIIFRLVVPASKIGKVIGKQGAQIKLLREETGAHIKITDPIRTDEDRVIMISSKEEDAFESLSAAENALLRLATVVVEEHGDNSLAARVGPQHHAVSNLTRLLIGRSQAGCLIGRGGTVIKDIRESTGASVRILPPDQLPLCSSASETDRLVQVSGELFQVQRALELIASKLRENPPKEAVTLRPALNAKAQQQMLLTQVGMQQFGDGSGLSAPGTTNHGSLDSQGSIPTGPKITVEMSVPSALMGGIIGRAGANITYIRTISGCAVKVFGQKEEETDRIICFEGTAEQVSVAQGLVQAYMNVQ